MAKTAVCISYTLTMEEYSTWCIHSRHASDGKGWERIGNAHSGVNHFINKYF